MKLAPLLFLAIFFAASFALGGLLLGSNQLLVQHTPTTASPVVSKPVFVTPDSHKAIAHLPAVDADGKGVLTTAAVEVRPGEGGVYTNVADVFAAEETQESFRDARDAAAAWAGIDPNSIDVTITVKVDDDTKSIEGPSAGASIAAAIGAAVKGATLNPAVAMTGTIDEQGNVGPVGAIREKTQTAAAAGIKLFLVPPGQGHTEIIQRIQKCLVEDRFTYCKTSYEPTKTSSQQTDGIAVKEVHTLAEALKEMLVQSGADA